jgi:hypothetical protein
MILLLFDHVLFLNLFGQSDDFVLFHHLVFLFFEYFFEDYNQLLNHLD